MKTNKIPKIMRIILVVFLTLTFSISDVLAQDPEFWGMTSYGGDYNTGTIFKTDNNGNNHSVEHSFFKYDGRSPRFSKLCEASNGKLYGMTQAGGTNDNGVIFEYDIETDTYIKKFDFTGFNQGSLMQATNGKLYGTTLGAIFEYDPSTDTYIEKFEFDDDNTGRTPNGSLIQASNGKLYGMTRDGGSLDRGVLFEYDLETDIYTKKINFGSSNGGIPEGGLMQASNGKLYGMTQAGGTTGYGVIFEYDPATDTYTKKFEFDGENTGGFPHGSLMQATNGKLYGMTRKGGKNDYGVLFEYDPITNIFVKKLNFNGSNKGRDPWGSLIQAQNGKLYGMTSSGGANDYGVLFEYDIETDIYTKKIDFGDSDKGREPRGTLMEASNGKLYGMTEDGGKENAGVIFEFDPTTDNIVNKLNFNYAKNGKNPFGSLMHASNDKLYGMTEGGGANNYGVLFEFDMSTNTYTSKLDFDGSTLGGNPCGNIIQTSNGKLYGMTKAGGTYGKGVLFEYDPETNNYDKKLNFDGENSGSNPNGSLIQASNGKLYGMSKYGGGGNDGVLFEYAPATDTYIKKFDFDGENSGSAPCGSLMEASNGKLYGMTKNGGTNDDGVLFEYVPATSNIVKKLNFNGSYNGSNPCGSLIQAQNGKLYGMTSSGGANDYGVLFEYDIETDIYTKKIDFGDSDKGREPRGTLMEASNGKLYGMSDGGANYYGVLFEYDPTTNIFVKKMDFDKTNGPVSNHNYLIEIGSSTSIAIQNYSNIDISVYPNPTNGIIIIEAKGIERVEIINLKGETIYNSGVIPVYIDNNMFVVNLNGNPKNVYFIKVITNKGIVTKKIVFE